ncbi:T9SS type A sorting domain-containing protein [Xanthomarina sp. F1114]|uniref:T9SS type A sorting domain-containing protein n=1 Tax=Xanthomarina sp. F1114 TaxID=2996019 RepID=UPI00225E38EE|nr:T9SS type A sorting domain-containing protein [Xanthomarina sp. F1114]MCX7549133.1 T9SS type A sorting domain-containing protein [Xanthomarina sp. F1114]
MKKNYILFLFSLLFVGVLTAQTTLTQSVDPLNVTDGGVACWNSGDGTYSENSFLRAYNLADFGVTDDFEVSSVQYGQGSADDGKVITVSIYTASSDNLGSATLTLIASADHTSSSADDLSLVTVPLTATIPAGSTIAFEVTAGDSGTNAGETFFPGINAAGENDDSYLVAVDCGMATPTTATVIGFPDNQYVMNVVGDVLGIEEYSLNNLSIYPNPINDVLNIQLNEAIKIKDVKVYSITGQIVIQGQNQRKLNVSQLNPGVYLLKIQTDRGDITRKIIKS